MDTPDAARKKYPHSRTLINDKLRVCDLIRVLYTVELNDSRLLFKGEENEQVQRQELPLRENRPKSIMKIHSI